MIKKFEQMDVSLIQKVNYIDLNDLQYAEPDLNDAVKQFVRDNDHNNGWAHGWCVFDPKGNDDYSSYYVTINNYFIKSGIKNGEVVIIHSVW
jgi:hypothetical protein